MTSEALGKSPNYCWMSELERKGVRLDSTLEGRWGENWPASSIFFVKWFTKSSIKREGCEAKRAVKFKWVWIHYFGNRRKD